MKFIDLSHFNNQEWAGLAVFLGIVSAFFTIYTSIFTEEERERQRLFLLDKLEFFSNIPLEHIGKYSAKYFTYYLEKFFGKPKSYNLKDNIFWNIRSNLLFIIIALAIILYNLYTLEAKYADYYPVFIFILPFISNCVLGHRIRIEKINYEILNLKDKKNKKLRSSIKKLEKRKKLLEDRNYSYCLYITSLVYTCIFIFIYFVFKLFEFEFTQMYSNGMLINNYSTYYIFGVFIFALSRIFIKKISKSNSLFNTIKIVFMSSIIIILSLIFAYILLKLIEFNTKLSFSNPNIDLYSYVIILAITLTFPLLTYLIILFLEVFARFLIKPIQITISIFFKYILKWKIHILVLVLLLIYSIDYFI